MKRVAYTWNIMTRKYTLSTIVSEILVESTCNVRDIIVWMFVLVKLLESYEVYSSVKNKKRTLYRCMC